jgi:carbon monoxide dehydrogenase subunit G
MARIRVSTVIDAPADSVWSHVEDIASHVHWMADAVEIRFHGEQTSGVGTTFDCDTKVGPLRLTDVMEVTEWTPGSSIGVRHVGVVTGNGRFALSSAGPRQTRLSWEEDLTFPWWLGGRAGAIVGAQVLELIWKRSLRTLKRRVETTG